ncbi:hypothetical protein, partial [Vibrio agarivorans]
KVRVTTSISEPTSLVFRLFGDWFESSVALSLEGLAIVKTDGKYRFSNPNAQFMQSVTIPQQLALTLIRECHLSGSIELAES